MTAGEQSDAWRHTSVSQRAADRRHVSGYKLALVAMAWLLAIVVIVNLGWSIRILLQPGEVMYGESIIYDQAARLHRGEPLYQPPDQVPYTVAAYTPVYYLLTAGLQATLGPGFWPGRALSIAAGLAVAILVACLAASRAGDRRAGLFAALMFLALGVPGIPTQSIAPWSSLYKQDVLGVAFSIGAIATLTLAQVTFPRVVLAASLAALAVLTKQTFVSATLAGTAWLWRRDRKKTLVFIGIALISTLGVCAWFEVTTGAFLANTVWANVNPFSLAALVPNALILTTFQAGPLAIAGLYVADRVRIGPTDKEKLLIFFWIASLVPLVGLAKVGSNFNYWIEPAAITAVLATLGIWAGLREARLYHLWPVVPLLLLGIGLASVAPRIADSAIVGLAVLRAGPNRVEEFNRLVERVRIEPGDVLANPLDVVVLAGRPTLLEPYLFNILGSEGRWDPQPLVQRICSNRVRLLVVNHRLEVEGPAYQGYAHWPPDVLSALRDTAVFEESLAGRFVYALSERDDGEICHPLPTV